MKHILVVEDEQHLAIGIKYNLEAEGYHVSVAADGPAALQVVEQGALPVDLVILDLMLPGMSGYAVCEYLRTNGYEMPVLMLSARTLSEDRTRGFEAGTDQYLMKPFDLDELLARVSNLLTRHGHRQPIAVAELSPATTGGDLYTFGRARVNFDTFQATVADKTVRLTHIEIKLLRYFVENEGRVVSRDEVLEHVWGYSTSPSTRTVDNFVMRLRRHFEEDPTRPSHFLSIRGAGYRFVASGEPSSEGEAKG